MEVETLVYRVGPPEKSPGPGQYQIHRPTHPKGGTISPRFRKHTTTDDPAIVALPSFIGKGPKVSMSFRPKDPPAFHTPGPSYVPPPFGSNSRAHGFSPITFKKKRKANQSPGPASYSPRYYHMGDTVRSASIPRSSQRLVFAAKKDFNTPVYSPRYDKVAVSSPAYSIQHKNYKKTQASDGDFLPGPPKFQTNNYGHFARSGRKDLVC